MRIRTKEGIVSNMFRRTWQESSDRPQLLMIISATSEGRRRRRRRRRVAFVVDE
jgi:hypothetical protein